MDPDYKLEYAMLKGEIAVIQSQHNDLLRKHASLENSYDELRIKLFANVCFLIFWYQ